MAKGSSGKRVSVAKITVVKVYRWPKSSVVKIPVVKGSVAKISVANGSVAKVAAPLISINARRISLPHP